MQHSSRATGRYALHTLSAAILITQVACGGGGDSSEDTTPISPSAVTLSGTIAVDQVVQGARVCVDLNRNGACDAGEPTSALTDANGRYTLRYQPASASAATTFNQAPVLGLITAQSVDKADGDPFGTTLTLSAPAGKASQINPLTTLVQLGIANGLTLATAEAAVVQQLGLGSAAKLYNYQDDPVSDTNPIPATARTAALATSVALAMGATPTVVASNVPAIASSMLARLTFTDVQNYSYRVRQSDGTLNANGFMQQFETRVAKVSGILQGRQALFPSITLTPTGWKRCDANVPRLITRGNPGLTHQCQSSTTYLGFVLPLTDVSGQSMATVVNQLQNGDPRLDAAEIQHDANMQIADLSVLGNAVFPAGSTLRTGVSIQLGSPPAFINNTNVDRIGTVALLEDLISTFPAAGANLANASGTASGMGPVDGTRVLRAAFIDNSTAQFYACEGTAPAFTDPHNCTPHSQSRFQITTVNQARVLTFDTFPGLAAQNGSRRGYTEYDGQVFAYRQPPATINEDQAITYNQRLNGTAWAALKTTLGIVD